MCRDRPEDPPLLVLITVIVTIATTKMMINKINSND